MSHSTAKPKCPACQQEVVTFSEGQCVVCTLCSKVKRRVYRFCRDCQRQWPHNTSPSSLCKQKNCALRAALLSDERISDPSSSAVGCPYFRACPKCNALLTHTGEGCPNIACPECHTEFCFRCLKSDCFLREEDYDDDYDYDDDDDDEIESLHELEECIIVDNSQSLVAFS
ncbi:uncharacterized protein Hap1MRO34_026288 [Clarias gariepinus]|uniref:uncharacterized protein si:ch211-284e13.9 n=1 Tax=Clarias gariepinus TaxID=13013 RepID=UPI00234C5BA3|nr:uncharacterized protein si:ch211-284e13.9 [Clarias gariepinus]